MSSSSGSTHPLSDRLRRFWRWFKAPPTSRQVGWWLVIAMACEITFVLTDEPWWFAANTVGLAVWIWWMPDAHDRKWAGATKRKALDWDHRNHYPRSHR